MPAKSAKQFGAMMAAKHGMSSLGIPPEVGEDFVSATSKSKQSKFAKALKRKKKNV